MGDFFTSSIYYLRHIMRPVRMEIACHTCDCTHDSRPPKAVAELKSFPRFCNLFRWFVTIFARFSTPLNKMLRKDRPEKFGQLTQEETTAMRKLQEKLISSLALAIPGRNGKYVLDTDASNVQLRCVLKAIRWNKHTNGIFFCSLSMTHGEHTKLHTANATQQSEQWCCNDRIWKGPSFSYVLTTTN